jgi:SAM-dependent methyltransferase
MTAATGTAEATCWACGAQARLSDDDFGPLGLYRCASCGLLFDVRPPEELRELYDETYFRELCGGAEYLEDEPARRREARKRVRWIRRHGARGRLLEIGAGTGHFLAAAREGGFEAVGVEPSEVPARMAVERLGVDVRHGFLEDVDLPTGAFDVAAGWHVVEHIRDPLAELRRVRDSLRPGGLFFVEVPNAGGIDAQREGVEWPPLELSHHVAQYGPDSLRRLLERAGFEVELTRSYEWTSYYPLGRFLSPYIVARHHLPRSLRRRALTFVPHPWRHDLLRAVARRVS